MTGRVSNSASEQGEQGEGGLTSRDTLHTTTTGETADGGLGDALDVVAKNLAMTLCATLSETLATLSAYSAVRGRSKERKRRKRKRGGKGRRKKGGQEEEGQEDSRPVMFVEGCFV